MFHDAAAMAHVAAWLWPQGPVCPRCGVANEATKLGGKSTRLGTYTCRACRKPFTVRIGTILEASHVPMHLWLQAVHLLCSSKKGISSNQLHRTLGVTLKTAWFMSHRIRKTMRDDTRAGFATGGGVMGVNGVDDAQRADAVLLQASGQRLKQAGPPPIASRA